MKSIHNWHLHVEKGNVKVVTRKGIYSLAAILNGNNAVSAFFEQAHGENLVDAIVLGKEDPQGLLPFWLGRPGSCSRHGFGRCNFAQSFQDCTQQFRLLEWFEKAYCDSGVAGLPQGCPVPATRHL